MKEKQDQAPHVTFHGYSWGFKITVVEQIENGLFSINQAAKNYGVSRTSIQRWVEKYGNLDRKLREMGGKSPRQEIKELKKKLEQMELENSIYETLFEVLEKDFGVDLVKKHFPEWQKLTDKNTKKS